VTPASSGSSFPFRYRVYGLRAQATGPLPGLSPLLTPSPQPAPGACDIVLHWGRLPPTRVAAAGPWERLYASGEEDEGGIATFVLDRSAGQDPVLRLGYADGTRFWLRARASEIWAWWPDTLTPEDASTYLLGPVLGYVLRLRGLHVLHGSAVRLAPRAGQGGRGRTGALALVGPPGAGKSTLAAALARRGYAVLTEDVCALCERGMGCRAAFGEEDVAPGTVEVLPGYPLIRLWPDAVEMLYGSPDVLPLLTPTWEKRYLPLGEGGAEFCREPAPLHAIVLLAPREDADAPRVERVAPAEALIHLVGNTYKNLLLDREQRVSEFRFLHRLLTTVPAWRAVAHTDPAYLGALLELVLEVG
jgi:hypothetical protein